MFSLLWCYLQSLSVLLIDTRPTFSIGRNVFCQISFRGQNLVVLQTEKHSDVWSDYTTVANIVQGYIQLDRLPANFRPFAAALNRFQTCPDCATENSE